MRTYLEGLDAAFEPCTLALLVPVIGLLLARGAGAWRAWSGYVLGAAVMFWARASGRWNVDDRGVMAIVIAVVVAAAFVLAYRQRAAVVGAAGVAHDSHGRPGWGFGSESVGAADFGVGAVVGAIAGWLWLPCVGTQLGIIINEARFAGPRTLGMMVLYVAGAATIGGLLTLAPVAVPRAKDFLDKRVVRSVGLAFGAIYALLIAIGQYDDLLSELFRRSNP